MKEYYDEREKILNTTNIEEEKTYVVSGIRDMYVSGLEEPYRPANLMLVGLFSCL